MAQFDFRDIFRLDFINPEADHQIRHDLGFFFGGANDADGFIDIQQDFLKAFEQMQAFFRLAQIKINSSAHTFRTKRNPF